MKEDAKGNVKLIFELIGYTRDVESFLEDGKELWDLRKNLNEKSKQKVNKNGNKHLTDNDLIDGINSCIEECDDKNAIKNRSL